MLRVIVTLTTRPEMNLVAEPAAIRQGHARAAYTVLENLDRYGLPVFLDLAFDSFECHYCLSCGHLPYMPFAQLQFQQRS